MADALPSKLPAEVLDYTVDWSDRLGDDTIATSTFTLQVSAGMTKTSEAKDNTTATVWLSGGTAGLTGTIINQITTAGGRTMDETLIIMVAVALVVETGTGLSTADSYASLAQMDAYAASRGLSAWTGNVGDKESALRRATDYLGATYGSRFAGYRASTTQALDFPRYDVPMPGLGGCAYYRGDEVPPQVSKACMELAVRALAGPLTPDLTQAVKREKVGPVEVEYQDYSRATNSYPAIDDLLAPLLAAGGGARFRRA